MDADVNEEQCDSDCSIDGPAAPIKMVRTFCGACGRDRLDRYILAASPADDGALADLRSRAARVAMDWRMNRDGAAGSDPGVEIAKLIDDLPLVANAGG